MKSCHPTIIIQPQPRATKAIISIIAQLSRPSILRCLVQAVPSKIINTSSCNNRWWPIITTIRVIWIHSKLNTSSNKWSIALLTRQVAVVGSNCASSFLTRQLRWKTMPHCSYEAVEHRRPPATSSFSSQLLNSKLRVESIIWESVVRRWMVGILFTIVRGRRCRIQ